jgi:hypothetical protein
MLQCAPHEIIMDTERALLPAGPLEQSGVCYSDVETGSVPAPDFCVRGTPADVTDWAPGCLDQGAPEGGMIRTFGGGGSPGTPAENVDALLRAARARPAGSNRERTE